MYKWIPVNDYVELWKKDVEFRMKRIIGQTIKGDRRNIVYCVYSFGAFRDIYNCVLSVTPMYICIIDVPNVNDIDYDTSKVDEANKHVEQQRTKKAELTALADKYCVASFDCSCRYEHKELVTALSWVKLQDCIKKEFYWELHNADTAEILNKTGDAQSVIPAPSLQELILIATSIRSTSQSERVLTRVNKEFIVQASVSQPISKFIDCVAKIVLQEKINN